MKSSSFLDGQMLIAMPGMSDPRFDRSVVFMCAHSDNGAMGIIVNKRAPMISFSELLDRLDILPQENRIKLPDDVQSMLVQFGGPVEPGAWFRAAHIRLFLSRHVAADRRTGGADGDARHIARHCRRTGSRGARFWRWVMPAGPRGSSRMRSSAMAGSHCAADEDLLFSHDLDSKYLNALHKIGVDPAMLSGEAGHA